MAVKGLSWNEEAREKEPAHAGRAFARETGSAEVVRPYLLASGAPAAQPQDHGLWPRRGSLDAWNSELGTWNLELPHALFSGRIPKIIHYDHLLGTFHANFAKILQRVQRAKILFSHCGTIPKKRALTPFHQRIFCITAKTNPSKTPMKTPPSPTRLGNYLAATATLGTLASSADAAIVDLDVSSISGLNGGVASGNKSSISLSSLGASLGGTIGIFNDWGGFTRITGLTGYDGLQFAIDGNKPRNFESGSVIDGGQSYSSYFGVVMFLRVKYNGDIYGESPDFGSGSYMGFRVDDGNGDYNYGWLEVTWDSADDEFYILSGAYESSPNTPIATPSGGGGVSAIPEPGSAFGTLGILAAGMMIRRRGKKAA